MTKAEYEQFAKEIRAGGFYTNGKRSVGQKLFSTVVCANGPKPLTGNSFWVTRFGGHWYLGTWGVRHYQVPDEQNAVDVCLTWLRRKPDVTSADFDDALKVDFNLTQLSVEEFEAHWSAAGLSSEDDAEQV